MTRRVLIAAAVAGVATAASTVAYAASMTVTSAHLGAVTSAAPKLYPNSLATANKSTAAGKAQASDTLTVGYSEELSTASLCGGKTTTIGTTTISGATVTITNNSGATGNDVLSVTSVPTTSCTGGTFHFGTVDLGAAGYVTSATATFTSSTLALTQAATSASLVITLGSTTATVGTVSTGAAAVYTPDVAITDTAARSIAANTSATTTTTQF